jgi:phosphoribosylformylglycinamidine synthase subunit PurQ / glutaminase
VKVGVVTFPGSLDDRDAMHAVEAGGAQAVPLWHADMTVGDVDAIILPGGFSYGDYLRCGAVAHRAPVMEAVAAFARDGGPVLGICNGFQVLCESGLLPGALLRNAGLRFVCRPVDLLVENRSTPWTRGFLDDGPITVPIKNGEGRYYADAATLDALEANGQVVFRYAPGDNPNGSERDIAGICNEAGNVVGLMPHPEHAVDPVLWGGSAALPMFQGLVSAPVPS